MAKKKASSRAKEARDEKSLGKGDGGKKGAQLKVVERPSHFKGIEQLVFVEASSLKNHPDNWKTHNKRQLDSLDAEFSSVGWVAPMVYNLETGRLLDGHGRKQTQHVKQTGVVPVVVGRWKEEEEDQILLHLDPVGGMFETDGAKFRVLMDRYKKETKESLEEVQEEHKHALDHLNESLETHTEALEYGAPASFLPDYTLLSPEQRADDGDVLAEQKDERENVVKMEESSAYLGDVKGFQTFWEMPFNSFGKGGLHNIPDLREDMLGSVPSHMQTWVGPGTPNADSYFYIYGSCAIEKIRSNDLIVAYYTHDYKFESVWNDPRKFTARMVRFKVRGVVTPSYSPWLGSPVWFQIYQIARSRWLGRYWQEAGLKVIPDIALVNLEHDEMLPLLLTGLPKEPPCVAIQAQNKGGMQPEAYYALAKTAFLKVLKHIHPRQILVYHGPDLPKGWLSGVDSTTTEIIPVKAWMWERTKIMKQKDYLNHD